MCVTEAEVRMIEGLYDGTKGRVLIGSMMSEEFHFHFYFLYFVL